MTDFRIVIFAVVIVILGILSFKKIHFTLDSEPEKNEIIIRFNCPESNVELVEQSVTSVIENNCSNILGIAKIASQSSQSHGEVNISFKKGVDRAKKRFEIAAVIRRLYPTFTLRISYPEIYFPSEETSKYNDLLLTYSFTSNIDVAVIENFVEKDIRKKIAFEKGISSIEIPHSSDFNLSILYDINKCNAWKIDPAVITKTLDHNFADLSPGMIKTSSSFQYSLKSSRKDISPEIIRNTRIPNEDGVFYLLNDLAEVHYNLEPQQKISRKNGVNTLRMQIYGDRENNQLETIKQIKRSMASEIAKQNGIVIMVEYEKSDVLKQELWSNFKMILISVSLILIFLVIAYRKLQVVALLASGIALSTCLSILIITLLNKPINLHSLISFVIGYSLFIYNVVLTSTDAEGQTNFQIIKPAITSNLLIIGALMLIASMPVIDSTLFQDFAGLLVISLVSSLIVLGIFLQPLRRLLKDNLVKRSTEMISASGFYFRVVNNLSRFKRSIILFTILVFGIPVFIIPDKIEGNQMYNRSLGSENFREIFKPKLDKWLGGTMGAFVRNIYAKSYFRNSERTVLYVEGELQSNTSVAQLNDIFLKLEAVISRDKRVENFITEIGEADRGRITINFKNKNDAGAASSLKLRLINESLEFGGINWNIYGVGDGFSNEGFNNVPNFRIKLTGYNYTDLEKVALKLHALLATNSRVADINDNFLFASDDKVTREYGLRLSSTSILRANISTRDVSDAIAKYSDEKILSQKKLLNGEPIPVIARSKRSRIFSTSDLLHNVFATDSGKYLHVDSNMISSNELKNSSIHREDRQYIRIVSMTYQGSAITGENCLKKFINDFQKELPAGFSIEPQYGFRPEISVQSSIILILIFLLLGYIICAIALENVKLPILILYLIPLTYIGLFVAFIWGEFNFDQGGFAAMIILAGIASNSLLNILMRQQSIEEKQPDANVAMITNVLRRAKPTIISLLSIAVSLLPFCFDSEILFWFPFAIGTIGGILALIIIIFILFPVMLWKYNPKKGLP